VSQNSKECIFCDIEADRVLATNEFAYVIHDGFPVTEAHSLIIPKRHVADYFDLATEEKLACGELLSQTKEHIQTADPSVEGFNIGINVGEAAGQTIFHCHMHLIPRRKGDVESPRGGVRAVIPGKGDY